MERRIDRIYDFVKGHNNVTTQDVAVSLNLQRTNVSKDLNELVAQGLLRKTSSRPVRYFSVGDDSLASVKQAPSAWQATTPTKNKPHKKEKTKDTETNVSSDIFASIIGSTGSMRNAVDQAKAAILYPPKGLNCLITGPTGSGKTFFAHSMFQFAQAQKIISQDHELVVFNCADYANNGELLMSHLFGYVKGAFTGAETDKVGLIQKADGGMLFLDEIHRLPPEGQEMIFYFMDHGSYSRLGESSKNNHANVRIVGATTENPSSSLLDTFTRRIPITIKLPPFDKRPAAEQIDLVRVLVALEANRIQRKIILTEDVVKALIGSVSYGNIGQLKSNVQLICARGFMNHMNQQEISITINDLTENIKSGLVQLAADRLKAMDLSPYLESEMVITPNAIDQLIKTDPYELPYNLYDIIGDKAKLLKAEGLDQEKINHFISTDINIHLKSFYKDHGFTFDTKTRLAEFVDEKVIEISNQVAVMVSQRLQKKLHQNFIYALSLHISSLLKKLHMGESRELNDNINEMAKDYPQERGVAREVRQMVEKELHVVIPESEDDYLTVLLVSLRENQPAGRIGIVVAAHGNTTATSMVQVVRELLDATNILAVDMPLDMHPRSAFEEIQLAVEKVDEGSGVLLLVDMGSLASFNEELQEKTGVLVRTLDMVTTPLLLEAARKSSTVGADAEELYESLLDFRGYERALPVELTENPSKEKVILAICASGEGTALRLKELLEQALQQHGFKRLQVLTLSVADLKSQLPRLKQEYEIVATTGIVKTSLSVPHIPMENLINQAADDVLESLLLECELQEVQQVPLNKEQGYRLCIQFMEESYTFINGKKLIAPLWQVAEELLGTLETPEAIGSKMNLVLHLAGSVERTILQHPLKEPQGVTVQADPQVTAALHALGQQLQMAIPASEAYYVQQYITESLLSFK